MIRLTSASPYRWPGRKSSTSHRRTASLFLRWTGMMTRRSEESMKFWRRRRSSSGSDVGDKAACHQWHSEHAFGSDDLVDSRSHRRLELGIVAHRSPVIEGGLGIRKPECVVKRLNPCVGKNL